MPCAFYIFSQIFSHLSTVHQKEKRKEKKTYYRQKQREESDKMNLFYDNIDQILEEKNTPKNIHLIMKEREKIEEEEATTYMQQRVRIVK